MAKEGKKSITIILDEETHRDLKVKTAMEGTSIQDFVETLIKKAVK